jgi:hypothetical protein
MDQPAVSATVTLRMPDRTYRQIGRSVQLREGMTREAAMRELANMFTEATRANYPDGVMVYATRGLYPDLNIPAGD